MSRGPLLGKCGMAALNRRDMLLGSAALGAFAGGLLSVTRLGRAGVQPIALSPHAAEVALALAGPTRGVLTYGDGAQPPPVLRAKAGEPFAVKLVNMLSEPTTVHWHGLRIANAMDGVPFLTQPYVNPGESFDYVMTPPDAGTFWYHPHCNTLVQMGRGLTGVLVVEGSDEPEFDAEVVLNLRDWRLGADGQFIEQFRARDAARSGTFGTVRTANWIDAPNYDAPAGGLLRIRLAATDVTRIYTLSAEGAEVQVLAIDGNPVPTPFPLARYMIGPGQRLDALVRMPDDEGQTVALTDQRGTTPKVLATFRAVGVSLKRALQDAPRLAANPIADADLGGAQEVTFVFSATAEGGARESFCGSLGYTFWAINKTPWPGDTSDPMAPLAEFKLGRSYILNLENPTPHAHPIHLHGMSFRVLSSSKREVMPLISDTYLLLPDERVRVALVADNPGDWAFHCHIIEHQKSGMAGYVRVA